jgi:hypothetical protein
MKIHDIIKQALAEVGADGLASDDCGCGIEDLQPCESGCMDCVPALRVLDPFNNQPIWVGVGDAHKYVRAPACSPASATDNRPPGKDVV